MRTALRLLISPRRLLLRVELVPSIPCEALVVVVAFASAYFTCPVLDGVLRSAASHKLALPPMRATVDLVDTLFKHPLLCGTLLVLVVPGIDAVVLSRSDASTYRRRQTLAIATLLPNLLLMPLCASWIALWVHALEVGSGAGHTAWTLLAFASGLGFLIIPAWVLALRLIAARYQLAASWPRSVVFAIVGPLLTALVAIG